MNAPAGEAQPASLVRELVAVRDVVDRVVACDGRSAFTARSTSRPSCSAAVTGSVRLEGEDLLGLDDRIGRLAARLQQAAIGAEHRFHPVRFKAARHQLGSQPEAGAVPVIGSERRQTLGRDDATADSAVIAATASSAFRAPDSRSCMPSGMRGIAAWDCAESDMHDTSVRTEPGDLKWAAEFDRSTASLGVQSLDHCSGVLLLR